MAGSGWISGMEDQSQWMSWLRRGAAYTSSLVMEIGTGGRLNMRIVRIAAQRNHFHAPGLAAVAADTTLSSIRKTQTHCQGRIGNTITLVEAGGSCFESFAE